MRVPWAARVVTHPIARRLPTFLIAFAHSVHSIDLGRHTHANSTASLVTYAFDGNPEAPEHQDPPRSESEDGRDRRARHPAVGERRADRPEEGAGIRPRPRG